LKKKKEAENKIQGISKIGDFLKDLLMLAAIPFFSPENTYFHLT